MATENQKWIIKDEITGKYFSDLMHMHFTDNKEITKTFNSEKEAVLFEENHIHNEIIFLDFDTIPVKW